MAIVKVHNKARNITYVYESKSYWDKDLKQPRSHRKLIGKVDPETGEVVPTGKRSKKEPSADFNSDTDYKVLYEQSLIAIEQKDALILELRSQLAAVEIENKALRRSIKKANEILMDTVAGKEQYHE